MTDAEKIKHLQETILAYSKRVDELQKQLTQCAEDIHMANNLR